MHEAVLGNCGTVVSFRIGAEDTRVIARAIGAPKNELTTLQARVCADITRQPADPDAADEDGAGGAGNGTAGGADQEYEGELFTPEKVGGKEEHA